jgi:hypothetical protein
MRKRREESGGGRLVLLGMRDGLHRNTSMDYRKDSRDYNGIQEFESGPSRITIDDLERIEGCETGMTGGCRTWIDYSASTSATSASTNKTTIQRTTPRRRRIAIAAALALPFLPYASAAPPIHRPDQTQVSTIPSQPTPTRIRIRNYNYPRQQTSSVDSSITSSASASASAAASASASASGTEPESRLDEEEIDYDIKYLTSMSTPTHALPTDVYRVAETRLPFYLSQDQQGSWTKVDDAWFLYGRQAGVNSLSFLIVALKWY